MIPHIVHRMKMQCSNRDCGHVFEYNDTEFMMMNDPGMVVFKCPQCGALTMGEVRNVDHYRWRGSDGWCYSGDVVYAYEFEGEECDGQYAGVARGESREYKEEREAEVIKVSDEPVWEVGGVNVEAACSEIMEQYAKDIDCQLRTLKDGYLAGAAGADDITRLEIRVKLSGKECRYMKEVNTEHDINRRSLVLKTVEEADLRQMINGVYTRDRCMAILEAMLQKWRLDCREVFFVSPFIGLPYKNEKYVREIRMFWNWLGRVLDMKKTRFITRRGSFNSLRKVFEGGEEEFKDAKKWHDLNELLMAAANTDGRKKNQEDLGVTFLEQFHAKFYAGVYDDRVEVIVGSYNIHSGQYLENMTFMEFTPEKFERDYLEPFGVKLRESSSAATGRSAVIEVDAEAGVSPVRITC